MSKSSEKAARRGSSGTGRRVPPGYRHDPEPFWRRPAVIVTGFVVAAIAAAVIVFVVLRSDDSSAPTTVRAEGFTPIDWSSLSGLQTGPAPWTANNGLTLSARLDTLGLPALGQEQLAFHIHSHVDIWIAGRSVPVPALVGINQTQGYLTELHTHDATGVVHVESAAERDYALGEFFGVWGVKLTHQCIGRYCAAGAARLRVWVDGTAFTGNPASIALRSHREIALVYGTAAQVPKTVPASFDFPSGE